jgi:surface antigen
LRVLQVRHRRKGKLRKHQRVWKFIQYRKASSFVGSLSIIALLGVFFVGHAQATYVEVARVQALSRPACFSCISYEVANSGVQYQEPFITVPRHAVPTKVNPAHSTAVVSGTSTQSAHVTSTSIHGTPVTNTSPHSTPVSSTITPSASLSTQGSENVFPYGSCTWWANQRYFQLHGIFVPWRTQADAWQWTARAYQFGWHVSSSPVTGSIINLQPWVQGAYGSGHVAVVERILGNGQVIASNMSWGANPWQVTYVEFAPGPGVTFIYR